MSPNITKVLVYRRIFFIYVFLTNKKWFLAFFSAFYGHHLVTAAWTNPSPWSICVQCWSILYVCIRYICLFCINDIWMWWIENICMWCRGIFGSSAWEIFNWEWILLNICIPKINHIIYCLKQEVLWDSLVFAVCEVHVFGPGGLRAPHMVVDGSKAGHCFHLLSPPSSSFYAFYFSPTWGIFRVIFSSPELLLDFSCSLFWWVEEFGILTSVEEVF